MARLPRGKQANRIYDYRHAGTTALLEGGSVRLAKADGEDCPLAEVDPLCTKGSSLRFSTLAPCAAPTWPSLFARRRPEPMRPAHTAFRRTHTSPPVRHRSQAAEIGRLVRGRLVVAHLSKSYQGALSKLGGGES